MSRQESSYVAMSQCRDSSKQLSSRIELSVFYLYFICNVFFYIIKKKTQRNIYIYIYIYEYIPIKWPIELPINLPIKFTFQIGIGHVNKASHSPVG